MRGRDLPKILAVLGALGATTPALADHGECRVVEVDLTPSADLQMVAWLEDDTGAYVETIYVTHGIGTYGLGNRPGILEFNSGPAWPYGRREQVFPVWAHRHGLLFPLVVFQNGDERNLSHPFAQSSTEDYYCRPIEPDEPMWDAGSCASSVYTDKGKFSDALTSRYPPRADVAADPDRDNPAVDGFADLNPFDEVSQATPPGDVPVRLTWTIPPDLPAGNYVVRFEVAKEFDMNASYNETTYPPPSNIPWASFGAPYRGQPSILYEVPIAIGAVETRASTSTFIGYGDPDGQDGEVRAPDATITVDVPGSGAARLALVPGSDGPQRIRVTARPEIDEVAPAVAAALDVTEVDHATATVSFRAPGDDGNLGTVSRYEIRYRANGPITDENFASATLVDASVSPRPAGELQTFSLEGLLPETTYHLAIRAHDGCGNASALASVVVETTARISGEVDACFIATAAYGSAMADDVASLRQFRDVLLEESVLGQFAVDLYYTFGPTGAAVIGQSELLRETAREALAPVVRSVRPLAF